MEARISNPEDPREPIEVMIERLTADLKAAARLLTAQEARYLVDDYYAIQDFRIQALGQHRAMSEKKEPSRFAEWLGRNMEILERRVKAALGEYAEASPVGIWSMKVPGIGPVLAAGYPAYIDIEQAPTVGHIWRFAGLDPTDKWEKKEKRPWNAKLKVLCWKTGESFVKVQANPNDVYGKVYAARKALEQERNAKGLFREQAEAMLKARKFGDDTVAKQEYLKGLLPPAHIHARAKRYAVKLFLAHWHHVAFQVRFGTPPPKPYILTRPEHIHYIAPPFWP